MQPEIQAIKDSLSLPVCAGWDRDFLESILEQIQKSRKLSDKQLKLLHKVLDRNSLEAQTEHEMWATVYEKEHHKEALVLAKYYMTTGYFKSMVRTIMNGGVPERKSFLKMKKNKYATKVLATHRAEPKYNTGDYVFPRSSFGHSRAIFDESARRGSWSTIDVSVSNFRTRGAIILAVDDTIVSAASGAKTYKILPIGATIPFIVEERFIKIKR
jgi:uncharacterized protein (DUF2141 family)|tara:strand:- start:561 stop:1202 length:642 start_codon:yes stop_codon:yes gene_type:complete